MLRIACVALVDAAPLVAAQLGWCRQAQCRQAGVLRQVAAAQLEIDAHAGQQRMGMHRSLEHPGGWFGLQAGQAQPEQTALAIVAQRRQRQGLAARRLQLQGSRRVHQLVEQGGDFGRVVEQQLLIVLAHGRWRRHLAARAASV